MKGLAAAWLTYVGIATYQWEKANRGVLPPPGIYLGSSLVFAGLGLLGEAAPGFATTFAWALIVAAGVSGSFSEISNTPVPTGPAPRPGRPTKTKAGAKAPGG